MNIRYFILLCVEYMKILIESNRVIQYIIMRNAICGKNYVHYRTKMSSTFTTKIFKHT